MNMQITRPASPPRPAPRQRRQADQRGACPQSESLVRGGTQQHDGLPGQRGSGGCHRRPGLLCVSPQPPVRGGDTPQLWAPGRGWRGGRGLGRPSDSALSCCRAGDGPLPAQPSPELTEITCTKARIWATWSQAESSQKQGLLAPCPSRSGETCRCSWGRCGRGSRSSSREKGPSIPAPRPSQRSFSHWLSVGRAPISQPIPAATGMCYCDWLRLRPHVPEEALKWGGGGSGSRERQQVGTQNRVSSIGQSSRGAPHPRRPPEAPTAPQWSHRAPTHPPTHPGCLLQGAPGAQKEARSSERGWQAGSSG